MGAEAQRATIFITVKIIRILVNTNYFHPPRAPVGSRGSSVWSSGTSRGVRISGARRRHTQLLRRRLARLADAEGPFQSAPPLGHGCIVIRASLVPQQRFRLGGADLK